MADKEIFILAAFRAAPTTDPNRENISDRNKVAGLERQKSGQAMSRMVELDWGAPSL
jgi:hypothetical protein